MFVHKVTKYDPADFGVQGYEGAEDCLVNDPLVEQAYIDSIADFATAAAVTRVALRDIEHYDGGRIRGIAQVDDDLVGILPGGHEFLHDGVEVDLATACELVRVMLRGSSFWARIEAEDRFFVHVGWDMYTYVGTHVPAEAAVASARQRGLYPEAVETSPYAPELDEEDREQSVADEAFWAELAELLDAEGVLLIEEAVVSNSTRWHRITSESVRELRAGVRPHSLLVIWPDLEPNEFEPDLLGGGTLVWSDPDGVLSWLEICVDDETSGAELDRLRALTRDAERIWLRPLLIESATPLLVGVLPDDGGVVRARWLRRTPAPAVVAWQALVDLATAVGFDAAGFDDEHDRYRLYRTAVTVGAPDRALQLAMVEDPDATMIATVVMERLDAFTEAEHGQWLAVVRGRSSQDVCDRRSREIAVARRAVRGELPVSEVARGLDAEEWSNMCLDRVCRGTSDREVLGLLAQRGPSRHIRESAELRHAMLSGYVLSPSQLDSLLVELGRQPTRAERDMLLSASLDDANSLTEFLLLRLDGLAQQHERRFIRGQWRPAEWCTT